MNPGAKSPVNTDPPPQAVEDKDLEAGGKLKRTPSRISVPLSRRSSLHSAPTEDMHADGQEQEDEEQDYEWGPSHPCFPHLNPHVPLSSPLYETTRIIRIKRDWMVAGDLAPTFANLYPEILNPYLPEDAFRQLIRKINDTLLEAFSPWSTRALLDAVIGMATLWLWDDIGFTGVKAKLRDLENWIENWNKNVGEPEGVRIIPLRRTGYLSIDIQIPDPQIETGRPDTRNTDLTNFGVRPAPNPPAGDGEQVDHTQAPQLHGEFGPYPVATDLGTLRDNGQRHLTPTVGA